MSFNDNFFLFLHFPSDFLLFGFEFINPTISLPQLWIDIIDFFIPVFVIGRILMLRMFLSEKVWFSGLWILTLLLLYILKLMWWCSWGFLYGGVLHVQQSYLIQICFVGIPKILHNSYFDFLDFLPRNLLYFKVLPGIRHSQPDLTGKSPLFVDFQVQVNQSRVRIILVPTEEPHSVENWRPLYAFAHWNCALLGQRFIHYPKILPLHHAVL